MKIYTSVSKDATKDGKEISIKEETNETEWQDFLTIVCQSIEERRKLLKPKSFRPKKKNSKV